MSASDLPARIPPRSAEERRALHTTADWARENYSIILQIARKRGRMMRRYGSVEDLAHDVALRLIQKSQPLRGITDIEAFVSTIVVNRARDILRVQRPKERRHVLGQMAYVPAKPIELPMERSLLRASMLRGLTEQERQVIRMRMDDYTGEEIARALSLSVSAANRTFVRAKEKMAANLRFSPPAASTNPVRRARRRTRNPPRRS